VPFIVVQLNSATLKNVDEALMRFLDRDHPQQTNLYITTD